MSLLANRLRHDTGQHDEGRLGSDFVPVKQSVMRWPPMVATSLSTNRGQLGHSLWCLKWRRLFRRFVQASDRPSPQYPGNQEGDFTPYRGTLMLTAGVMGGYPAFAVLKRLAVLQFMNLQIARRATKAFRITQS